MLPVEARESIEQFLARTLGSGESVPHLDDLAVPMVQVVDGVDARRDAAQLCLVAAISLLGVLRALMESGEIASFDLVRAATAAVRTSHQAALLSATHGDFK